MSVKIVLSDNKFYTVNIIELDKVFVIKEYINQNPQKNIIILSDLLEEKENKSKIHEFDKNSPVEKRMIEENNFSLTLVRENEILPLEKIFSVIIQYSALYPAGIEENPPPDKNSKHRNIKNLLDNNDEGLLFHNLLNTLTYIDQIHILLNFMRISEILKMDILFQKIGSVIAVKIKDKSISLIKEAFK